MAVPAFRSLNLGVLRIPDMLSDIDNPRQPSSSVVGRPYSAAGLGSGGAPFPCGAAPRGDPTKRPFSGRCGNIGASWRFRGVGPRA